MLIKDVQKSKGFLALDGCLIKELLSPLKQEIKASHSTAYATVLPGKWTRLHSLSCSEFYFITKGAGLIEINGEQAPVRKGNMVYIPPKAHQRIKNTGKCELCFLCIVDPPWRASNERIERAKLAAK